MIGNNDYLDAQFKIIMSIISLFFVVIGMLGIIDTLIQVVARKFGKNKEITIYVPDEGTSSSVKVRPDLFELQLPKSRGNISPPKFIDSPV